MNLSRPVPNQLNIVSSNLEASIAFYRRLGVDVPEQRVWRTATGAHHASAAQAGTAHTIEFEIDSAVFAQLWNAGWRNRKDLAGRVVVGFGVGSRKEVDRLYGEMTSAGHRGLQAPYDAFWGARYAVIEDPDGVAVGLMSAVTAEHRSQPPDI